MGTRAINSFRGPYFFLSNFYPHPVQYEGVIYPSAEHAYQAAKCKNRKHRILFTAPLSAGQTKRLGRRMTLRDDWEKIKLTVMEQILQDKFSGVLGDYLLSTEDSELVEENSWGDTFWGRCKGTGENHLGKLLMVIRRNLRGGAHAIPKREGKEEV